MGEEIGNTLLSGPLEQAASGRLIELMKVMKPTPEDYRFLKVRHCDELWKRHEFVKKRKRTNRRQEMDKNYLIRRRST